MNTVLIRKTKIYSDLLLNDTEQSFFFGWFHDFLRERSSGASLVIFRFLISSLTVIFITSPRFIPLNLRLDPWPWLLWATFCQHLFPELSDFPKDWVQWLDEKELCLMSCFLLQPPDDQVLLWLILSAHGVWWFKIYWLDFYVFYPFMPMQCPCSVFP